MFLIGFMNTLKLNEILCGYKYVHFGEKEFIAYISVSKADVTFWGSESLDWYDEPFRKDDVRAETLLKNQAIRICASKVPSRIKSKFLRQIRALLVCTWVE